MLCGEVVEVEVEFEDAGSVKIKVETLYALARDRS